MPSSTASRARRSNSARLSFGGNANGWPIFHSVVLRVDCLVCFLAMRSLLHGYNRVWTIYFEGAVAGLSPVPLISAMISCRLSILATLSNPNRCGLADREPTSGLL